MRRLLRNKRSFWYANYKATEDTTDEFGNIIGNRVVYTNPQKLSANISAARGNGEDDMFGVTENYSKTINPWPAGHPVDATSILWVNITPTINSDGSTDTPWDYKVVEVAESVNNTAVAIRKVDVGADSPAGGA